jgi:hypothetical protein
LSLRSSVSEEEQHVRVLLLDHTQKQLADVESLGGISLVVGDEERGEDD